MKEALLKIKGSKKIRVNFNVTVKNISINNELDYIEIDVEQNNILFEKLTLIKGEIFPVPKPHDIINIKQILINYDENLDLRLFIKGKIKSSFININNANNNYTETLSFSNNKILASLKNIIGIKDELFSGIFKIENIEDAYYKVFCLKDLKRYNINIANISLYSTGEFLLLSNYKIINKNEIFPIGITIEKKLTEEKLFQFYSKVEIFGKNLVLFKIIDVNEKYYILIDMHKNIYQMEKNKKANEFEMKICQLLLVINNFKIVKNPNTYLDDILFGKESIIYISNQDIYFSKLILLNSFTVINIHFLDYDKINIYNKLIIDQKEFIINNNENYIVFFCVENDFDYYSLEIGLQKSDDDIHSKKIFNFFVYKGLLNKINAFINYYSENAFFIEYYFMSVDIPLKEINTKTSIQINNKKYQLNNIDKFQSENRQRINVLNVPPQNIKDFDINKLLSENINSIQICEIFDKKESLIYGVFDIKQIINREDKIDNSYLDSYYDIFGDIRSLIMSNDYEDNDEIKDICINRLKNSKINKSEDFIISTNCNELTLSQFETRFGLLICHYLNKCKNQNQVGKFLGDVLCILKNISSIKLTNLQRLRIIILYLRKKFENSGSINEVIFFEALETDSPYVLAKELNKQEIIHLTEFSRYFVAYLQIDSYKMYNYYRNEESFTFSLELLFVMKYILLSNYEEFIFTTIEKSNEYAYNTSNENITVINEANLFPNNYGVITKSKDPEESKNLAFPISFEFRHEKNSHQKRYSKNTKNFSPFLFYRDGKADRIEVYKKIDDKIIKKGESGKMVERFLSVEENVISELKNLHIFGELLDYKYFIDKDFKQFLKKIKEIKEKVSQRNKLEKEKKKKENKDESSDTIKTFQIIDDKKRSELWEKKLEEEGIIKFGDIHFTKAEFEKIVKNSNNK